MNNQINLFTPGTLLSLNIGFWLNCPKRNYRIICENPPPNLADHTDNRIVLIAILDATRNGLGLVLEDKIYQAKTGDPFPLFVDQQKFLTVRKLDVLFGTRYVQILMNAAMFGETDPTEIDFSFFDKAFFVKLHGEKNGK